MDPEGEPIRRFLQSPKGGTWDVDGSQAGNVLTPGSQIKRWYTKVGGLQNAVDKAQAAMKADPDPEFKEWDPARLDEPIRIKYAEHLNDKNVNGSYAWQGIGTDNLNFEGNDPLTDGATERRAPFIEISDHYREHPHAGAQETLEHELSHHVTTGRPGKDTPLLPSPDGVYANDRYENYALSPSEVDVRLAVIKRMYAHHKGVLVETPEQARDALMWYVENHKNIDPNSPDNPDERLRADGTQGSLMPSVKLYLGLPGQMQKKILKRMPKVVNNKPLIERLASYG